VIGDACVGKRLASAPSVRVLSLTKRKWSATLVVFYYHTSAF
jgi:hypothetical protein